MFPARLRRKGMTSPLVLLHGLTFDRRHWNPLLGERTYGRGSVKAACERSLRRLDPFPQIDGPIVEVAPPRSGIGRAGSVREAAGSVVKVLGTACGLGVEGSGWVAAPELVDDARLEPVEFEPADARARIVADARQVDREHRVDVDVAAQVRGEHQNGFRSGSLSLTESNFSPRDTSSAGAVGLMQIMPATARGLGVDPHRPLRV